MNETKPQKNQRAPRQTIPPTAHRIINDPMDLIKAGDLVWTPGLNQWEPVSTCHYSVRVRNFHAVARRII